MTSAMATMMHTVVARAPSLTAHVRLPAWASVRISRRLFTESTASATNPTATDAHTAIQSTAPAIVTVVPSVATGPKNTNAAISPHPR